MSVTRPEARAALERLAAAPTPLVDPGFTARLAQQLGDLDLDELPVELERHDPRPARPRPGHVPRPSRTGWTLGGIGLVAATIAGALALAGTDDTTTVRVNDPGREVSIVTTTAVAPGATVPASATSSAATVPPTPSATTLPPVTAAGTTVVADPTTAVTPVVATEATTSVSTPPPTRPSTTPAPAVEPPPAPAPAPAPVPVPTTAPPPPTVAPTTEVTTPATMTMTCTGRVVTGQPVVVCEWGAAPGAASYVVLKGPVGRVLTPSAGVRRVEDHDLALGTTYTYVVWARDAQGHNLAHSAAATVVCCQA